MSDDSLEYQLSIQFDKGAAAQTQAGLAQVKTQLKEIDQNTKNISRSFNTFITTGRGLRELGMSFRLLSDFTGNEQLKKIADLTGGVGELVSMAGHFKRLLSEIKEMGGLAKVLGGGLGLAGAIGGGAVAGAAIYDATIGKAQGTDTGTVLKQGASVFNRNLIMSLTGDAAKANEAFTDTARLYGLIATTAPPANDALKSLSAVGDLIGKAVKDAVEKSKNFGQINQDFGKYQDDLKSAQQKFNADSLTQQTDYEKSYQDMIKRFGQENKAAYDSLVKSRMKIVSQGIDEEKKAETSYYKDRLLRARDFGIQAARDEAAHQIQMQRLSQDHGRRLSKLADQRDALGIEDEQENYRLERGRAEQDYNLSAQQRNEDYARQMADMEANFNDQRKSRADDRQKQLQELQQNYSEAAKSRQEKQSQELRDLSDQNNKKQIALKQGYDDEVRKLNDAFTERRQSLGLWYTGEEAQHRAHLKILGEQFDAWFKARAVTMGGSTQDYGGGVSSHAAGGYASGPTMTGEKGYEYILSHQTTRAAEGLLGGRLTQGRLLGSLIGSMTQNFSGQQSSPEQYRQIMYQTIVDVMSKAAQ
jgi:hypothetical protein